VRPGLRDASGVLGAVFAALCCAGTPWIIAGLTALGLGFVRRDGILWPLMLLALGVAVSGYWQGARQHGRWGSLVLGSAGALSLAAGVIVVHGFPAMEMIYGVSVALVLAAVWNALARRACVREASRAAV
jgi:mercuric ion transport protein